VAAAVPAPLERGEWLYERRRPRGRLRDISLSEIAVRGQQEATKWLERLTPPASYDNLPAALEERAPALATPDAARRWLLDAAPRRLFAGLDDPRTIAVLRDRMPDDCRDLIAAATDILTGHRPDVLG